MEEPIIVDMLNPIARFHAHVFRTVYIRFTNSYSNRTSILFRRCFETLLLALAVSSFCLLIYVHITFLRRHTKCLEHIRNSWPSQGGILRVEVVEMPSPSYDLSHSYVKESLLSSNNIFFNNNFNIIDQLFYPVSSCVTFVVSLFYNTNKMLYDEILIETTVHDEKSSEVFDETLKTALETLQARERERYLAGRPAYGKCFLSKNMSPKQNIQDVVAAYLRLKANLEKTASRMNYFQQEIIDEFRQFNRSGIMDHSFFEHNYDIFYDNIFIMEFSFERDLLLLLPATRNKLDVNVHFVLLDPSISQINGNNDSLANLNDSCFGNTFSRFIFKYLIGYDDLLMSSIKNLAQQKDGSNKGYIRNVVTGVYYRFGNPVGIESYMLAAFVMILFTTSVSMILKYSHLQIARIVLEFVQVRENQTGLGFHVAPILAIVLSFIGLETLMSEFFEDTATAFHIIVLLWLANQYQSVCCFSVLTRKHWIHFFYLYQFGFYAYHYRFGGQFSSIAFFSSLCFILHSMVYFYHHCEIPLVARYEGRIHLLLVPNQAELANNGARFLVDPIPSFSRLVLGTFQFFNFHIIHRLINLWISLTGRPSYEDEASQTSTSTIESL